MLALVISILVLGKFNVLTSASADADQTAASANFARVIFVPVTPKSQNRTLPENGGPRVRWCRAHDYLSVQYPKAHLTELSPNSVRALFSGLAYLLGVLLGSPGSSIEYALKNGSGYGNALAIFESIVIAALVIVFWFGPERKGKVFSDDN